MGFIRDCWLEIVAVGLLTVAASCVAHAQGLDKPVVLVASPSMAGAYSRAVLVVVPKGEGHVGFMLNRVSNTTVADVFPDEDQSAQIEEPIYLGGPRAMESMYAVVQRDPGEGSRRLFGDVFVTVSGKTVDRILRDTPHEARYFAGFNSWSQGELAEEVRAGEWLLAEPDAALLFHGKPSAMWEELVQRIQNTL